MRDTIWKDREVKSGDSVIKERDAAIPCLARVMVRVMVGVMKKIRVEIDLKKRFGLGLGDFLFMQNEKLPRTAEKQRTTRINAPFN